MTVLNQICAIMRCGIKGLHCSYLISSREINKNCMCVIKKAKGTTL